MAPSLILGRRADGAVVLSTSIALPLPLPLALDDIATRLRGWADRNPDRVLISAMTREGRRSLTYAQALAEARQLRVRLTAAGFSPGARIATLLPAGIDGLRLRLACLLGGFIHVALPPYPFRAAQSCPPAGDEAARLWRTVKPDLLVVPDGHCLAGKGSARTLQDLPHEGPNLPDHAGTPHEWSAIFFTAGSTGASKGVPVTRGMIASCQAACAAMWPFLQERPPVLIDWMPWNHVFGGLDNLFKVIWNGGTLHLAPPPSAEGMGDMLDLMAAAAPTMSIGVPLGLRLILDAYDADPDRVAAGFRNQSHIFFAGAAMEPALWERLARFRADMERRFGNGLAVLSGYGATEAASTMCLAPEGVTTPGILGWPLPGHEVALVPIDGRTEIRFRGPNLAPCYLTEDGEIPLPLDEHGFYRTGDAGLLEGDVLRFDGRISEDFKLSSGIKVRSGVLRAQIMSHIPHLADDIVLGGEGRDGLVALVFARGQATLEQIAGALAGWNRANPGSSTAITRVALADFVPDARSGEVSAKGQIVQSRVLKNRATLFAALSDGESGLAP